jgi:hypothetical protein
MTYLDNVTNCTIILQINSIGDNSNSFILGMFGMLVYTNKMSKT